MNELTLVNYLERDKDAAPDSRHMTPYQQAIIQNKHGSVGIKEWIYKMIPDLVAKVTGRMIVTLVQYQDGLWVYTGFSPEFDKAPTHEPLLYEAVFRSVDGSPDYFSHFERTTA